jgi:hypothetical protein
MEMKMMLTRIEEKSSKICTFCIHFQARGALP